MGNMARKAAPKAPRVYAKPPGGSVGRVTVIESDPKVTGITASSNEAEAADEKPRFAELISKVAVQKRDTGLTTGVVATAVGDRAGPDTRTRRSMPNARLSRAELEHNIYSGIEQPGRLTAEQAEMLLLAPGAKDPVSRIATLSGEVEIPIKDLETVLNHFRLPPPPT